MDSVLRVAEIHRARPKRISFAASHKARQVWLAPDHLLWRQPLPPSFHTADSLGARPGEAIPGDTDAIANCFAVADRQVKIGVRRINDDESGRLDRRIVDERATKPRR